MNAVAQNVRPVDLNINSHEVERIAGALEKTLSIYHAIPNFPDNQEIKALYWKQSQELCAELLGEFHA